MARSDQGCSVIGKDHDPDRSVARRMSAWIHRQHASDNACPRSRLELQTEKNAFELVGWMIKDIVRRFDTGGEGRRPEGSVGRGADGMFSLNLMTLRCRNTSFSVLLMHSTIHHSSPFMPIIKWPQDVRNHIQRCVGVPDSPALRGGKRTRRLRVYAGLAMQTSLRRRLLPPNSCDCRNDLERIEWRSSVRPALGDLTGESRTRLFLRCMLVSRRTVPLWERRRQDSWLRLRSSPRFAIHFVDPGLECDMEPIFDRTHVDAVLGLSLLWIDKRRAEASMGSWRCVSDGFRIEDHRPTRNCLLAFFPLHFRTGPSGRREAETIQSSTVRKAY